MRLLQAEQNLMMETFQENFLLITAEGLLMERLFFKHLELYSDPSVLVLVLNTNNEDQDYFMQLLQQACKSADSKRVIVLPKRLNATVSADERKQIYLEGGVVFATTRILVTDVLKENIPLNLVTGILFYRAEGVLRSSLESFIIRTFRERKSDGFVKAFSNNPKVFGGSGLGGLQRAVSALRIERVRFLPRFHADVIEELEQFKPELTEVPIQVSSSMRTLQTCVFELMLVCLQELKLCTPGIITEESTTLLENAFSWGFEKSLRRRLVDEENSQWRLSTKVREILTDISRLRHLMLSFENEDGSSVCEFLETIRRNAHDNCGWLFTPQANKIFEISKRRIEEKPPKWQVLNSIVDELKVEENLRVLVTADDERICAKLAENMIIAHPDLHIQIGNAAGNESADEQRVVMFLPLNEKYQLLQSLVRLQPAIVILYNAEPWIIRQLEIFNIDRQRSDDSSPPKPLKIFFLMYDNSAEEQRYLSSLKNERSAFDQLIKEDATLLIRKSSDVEAFQHTAVIDAQHSVVVDLREFRSELPTLLHARGVKMIPVTLIIGDYVLSSQICVERKSGPDLISSLTCGRLYDQCKAMCEHYQRPLILIELNNSKKSWRRLGDQIVGRLVSLTLAFKQIRLIWAASPAAAVDLLLDIKWKRDDPDVEHALSLGKDPTSTNNSQSQTLKAWAEQLLMCFPGTNTSNYGKLAAAAPDLRSLCRLNQKELAKNLQSETWGKDLFDFIHMDFRQSATKSTSAQPKRKYKRR